MTFEMKEDEEILLKEVNPKQIKKFGKKYNMIGDDSDSSDNEDSPLLNRFDNSENDRDGNYTLRRMDSPYYQIIKNVEKAILNGTEPERIAQGSSGSYFVKNQSNEVVGVFKPKDEEPYGNLNPKWTKWFHKHCCFCCFGRSFLVANQGYLSEAGASLVDTALGLNIVPKTKIVRLASTSFNYGPIDRYKSRTKEEIANRFPMMGKKFHRIGLPPKTGSMQLFVSGYKDASYWLSKFDSETLPEETYRKFRFEFEKMVVLDYIIRNTDRGNDNWLIKYDKPENSVINDDTGELDFRTVPDIKIAAIDNGLAFPYKPTDGLRGYPYGWAWLPIAKLPFSDEIKDLVYDKLSDMSFIQSLCNELQELFQADPHFDTVVFRKQMAVMRGQIINLVNSMKLGETPEKLAGKISMTLNRARLTNFTDSFLEQKKLNKVDPDFKYSENDYVAKYHKRPFFSFI